MGAPLFEKLFFIGVAAIGVGVFLFLKMKNPPPLKGQKASMTTCLPGSVGSDNNLDGLNSKPLAERTESSSGSGASSSCALCAG